MLDPQDPIVQFKLEVLRVAMPAASVILFGDIFRVDGGYAIKCLEYGADRVLVVDSLETRGWTEARLHEPRLDFLKGDFSNHLFMAGLREHFELSVAFDVLLHQPPLLSTLHAMLDRTVSRIAIVQPVLKERQLRNTLVYLPGSLPEDGLYPVPSADPEYRMFDVRQVNHEHWIWGMTPSFLRSVLAGEGFELIHEQPWNDLPNPTWQWWGAVAQRANPNPDHWAARTTSPGVYSPDW
jgi:hypothetical protein